MPLLRTLTRLSLWAALPAFAGCATSGIPSPEPPRSARRAGRPPSLPPAARFDPVLALVQASCTRHGVPVPLILGVIHVESRFQPITRSSAGARGLMQLMPATAASLARRLGMPSYDIDDPAFNVEAGTLYVSLLLKRFGGSERLALAAYNTGEYRVRRWIARGDPLAAYSERYVGAVLSARDRFAAEPGADPTRVMARRTERGPDRDLDRSGLLVLLRERERLYGRRPNAAVREEPKQASRRPVLSESAEPLPVPDHLPETAPAPTKPPPAPEEPETPASAPTKPSEPAPPASAPTTPETPTSAPVQQP